jgi:S-adenosylmethionine synthetase
MKNITIHRLESLPMDKREMEYVERKGIGHPDSLIDGIVDRISVELCKEYIDKIGFVLHHNVDKGLIVGGAAEAGFGKGTITKKIDVILAGRATDRYEGKAIDVNRIAIDTTKEYLRENTRFLDVDNEVNFESRIARGSADLTSIFIRGREAPLANDTSFGVGFAPFSETENLVLNVEMYLNSKEYKKIRPAVGEDVKIMGIREKDMITLTVAIAFVAHHVKSMEEYRENIAKIKEDIIQFSKKYTGREVEVIINHGDVIDAGDVYITKSGLSCESGDDGSVGRGNRVNGIITPFRYMSLEAAAGKNPISHVGKIYNIFANELAKEVVKRYEGEVEECNIAVVSQIGRRINDPRNLSFSIIANDPARFDSLKKEIHSLGEERLDNIGELTSEIMMGKYPVF